MANQTSGPSANSTFEMDALRLIAASASLGLGLGGMKLLIDALKKKRLSDKPLASSYTVALPHLKAAAPIPRNWAKLLSRISRTRDLRITNEEAARRLAAVLRLQAPPARELDKLLLNPAATKIIRLMQVYKVEPTALPLGMRTAAPSGGASAAPSGGASAAPSGGASAAPSRTRYSLLDAIKNDPYLQRARTAVNKHPFLTTGVASGPILAGYPALKALFGLDDSSVGKLNINPGTGAGQLVSDALSPIKALASAVANSDISKSISRGLSNVADRGTRVAEDTLRGARSLASPDKPTGIGGLITHPAALPILGGAALAAGGTWSLAKLLGKKMEEEEERAQLDEARDQFRRALIHSSKSSEDASIRPLTGIMDRCYTHWKSGATKDYLVGYGNILGSLLVLGLATSAIRAYQNEKRRRTKEVARAWSQLRSTTPEIVVDPVRPNQMDSPIIPVGVGVKESSHDWATVQLELDNGSRDIALKMARSISDDDITGSGREDVPHITVQYGLDEDHPPDISAGPVKVVCGKTAHWTNDDGEDVVYVRVRDTAGLSDLRKDVRKSASLGIDDDGHTYRPHITLAYVKKGAGQSYDGMDDLDGRVLTFDTAVFRDKSGKPTSVALHNA